MTSFAKQRKKSKKLVNAKDSIATTNSKTCCGKSRNNVKLKKLIENYKNILNEWIVRLGLTEWRIKVIFVVSDKSKEKFIKHKNNFKKEEVILAINNIRFETRTSTIRVVLPELDNKKELNEVETTLVHELLHLNFDILGYGSYNSYKGKIVHRLLDDISKALVAAKYHKKHFKYVVGENLGNEAIKDYNVSVEVDGDDNNKGNKRSLSKN